MTIEELKLIPGPVPQHGYAEAGLDLRVAAHKLASAEPFDFEADRERGLALVNRLWGLSKSDRDRTIVSSLTQTIVGA